MKVGLLAGTSKTWDLSEMKVAGRKTSGFFITPLKKKDIKLYKNRSSTISSKKSFSPKNQNQLHPNKRSTNVHITTTFLIGSPYTNQITFILFFYLFPFLL
jgi:hypothetical protein